MFESCTFESISYKKATTVKEYGKIHTCLRTQGKLRNTNPGGGTDVSTVGIGRGALISLNPGGGVVEPGGAGSSTPGGPSPDIAGIEEIELIVGMAELPL